MIDAKLVQQVLSGNALDVKSRVEANPDFWRRFVCPEKLGQLATNEMLGEVDLRGPLQSGKQAPGFCSIPVVVRNNTQFPHAADAIILPVRWIKVETHDFDGRLPQSINKIANEIQMEVAESPKLLERLERDSKVVASKGDYQLTWAFDSWNNVDLSNLELHPDSAFAPLAVGLISLMLGLESDGQLLVTGVRSSGYRWSVGEDHFEPKIAVALAFGFTRFALPKVNAITKETLTIVARSRKIDPNISPLRQAFLRNEEDLYLAVLPGLMMAGHPPPKDASKDEQRDWYLSLPTNKEAGDYYQSTLLNQITENNLDAVADIICESDIQLFFSVLSHNVELTFLALRLFRPSQAVLFWTRDESVSLRDDPMHKRLTLVQQHVEELNQIEAEKRKIAIVSKPLNDLSIGMLNTIQETVQKTVRKGTTILDLMPGKRTMILAMLEGAHVNDKAIGWITETDVATRRVVPFTEELAVWRVASDSPITRNPNRV